MIDFRATEYRASIMESRNMVIFEYSESVFNGLQGFFDRINALLIDRALLMESRPFL